MHTYSQYFKEFLIHYYTADTQFTSWSKAFTWDLKHIIYLRNIMNVGLIFISIELE